MEPPEISTAAAVPHAPLSPDHRQVGARGRVGTLDSARRARRRRLVPALIAVVVLVLVAGTVSLARLAAAGGDGYKPTTPAGAPKPAVSPARYFLTSLMGGGDRDQPYQEITIRNAVTGAVTAILPALNDSAWETVAATNDPWTFFALSVTKPLNIGVAEPPVRAPNRMYRLVVSLAGKVKSLKPIDSLGQPRFSGFALSPNGRQLAINGDVSDDKGTTAGISIIDVDGGRTRTFLADRVGASTFGLVWSADSRHLAYQLSESQRFSQSGGETVAQPPSDQNGIWILDASRSGTDLRASSHRVTAGGLPGHVESQLALGADGTRVYVVVSQIGGIPYVVKRIVELDAATGHQLRVFLEVKHEYSVTVDWQDSSLVVDPSGRLLMVSDGGADYYRIDLGTGRATRLPTAVTRGNPNGLAW